MAQLYVHAHGMLMLAPRAYGCFVAQGVRGGTSPSEVVASVARRSVGAARPAMVVCRAEPAVGEPTVTLSVAADGTPSVSAGLVSTPAPTLDDAVRSFGDALAAASAAMTSPVGSSQ